MGTEFDKRIKQMLNALDDDNALYISKPTFQNLFYHRIPTSYDIIMDDLFGYLLKEKKHYNKEDKNKQSDINKDSTEKNEDKFYLLSLVSISEKDGMLKCIYDIPGVKKEDINITVDGFVFIITADRKFDDNSEIQHFRNEYSIKELSSKYNFNHSKATVKDGVLTITIPEIQNPVITISID